MVFSIEKGTDVHTKCSLPQVLKCLILLVCAIYMILNHIHIPVSTKRSLLCEK